MPAFAGMTAVEGQTVVPSGSYADIALKKKYAKWIYIFRITRYDGESPKAEASCPTCFLNDSCGGDPALIPAQAGIQVAAKACLDARFRGHDSLMRQQREMKRPLNH